jgi:hypothetical protein
MADPKTRMAEAIAARARQQIDAAQQSPNAPAIAAGGGFIQRLGGEPIRPRRADFTGAAPIGSPLQFNQGIADGQPPGRLPEPPPPVALPVETLDFRVEAPENTTYVLAPYQHYAVQVVALEGVSGGTVATTPAVGSVANIGSTISITVSGVSEDAPLLGSILLRRV